ncbi:glycosyltransferase family 2 protein [Lachnospiraceae bacterium C1.1]|nr:glycosyltransferase [Lachnospiraceae bacterium C1.1]
MLEKPLVSVIVPIYMVEAYLPACIESIQNQTYENLEIILVDDGSKDDCGKIAEKYAANDSRIKVIHKENGGLSDARNAGIDIAEGEYFVFVDSDDRIHPQMTELLLQPVVENKADMSVCNFMTIGDDEKTDISNIVKADIVIIENMEDKTKYYFEEKSYVRFTVAWNKLYPRRYFEQIRYPKGKIHEDEFTTYKLLDKADRVAYIKDPLYYYVQRGSSIMGEGFNEKSLHRLEAMDERIHYYLELNNYEWAVRILFLYRLMFLRYAKQIKNNKRYHFGMLKPFFEIYRNLTMKNIFNYPISFKEKIGYVSMAIFPKMYIESHIK